VKFTPEKGTIKVEVRQLVQGHGYCLIKFIVSDTGIGISEDQQALLFNPFQQAEGSITRKYGGTGLGLSISKSIVELMGGSIAIESEVGKGSTFSFSVKLKQGLAKGTDPFEPYSEFKTFEFDRTNDFSHNQILLVEDVDINREIVLALLEPTRVKVDCATNGVEAIRLFSEDPKKYDIIFMDLQMPVMDGLEATRHIRSMDKPRAKTIPIIAMTANVFVEDIENCLKSGMNDHIGKPLDLEELLAKMRLYL
jgi:CheY-like chemotaxis protein